jgi:hypothetical protein
LEHYHFTNQLLKSKVHIVDISSLALHELDLLVECCLRADSYFIKANDDLSATLMRDCADITVLLIVLMKRKSTVEVLYLNFCIEVWQKCRKTLSDYKNHSELEINYECFNSCISNFRKYSLIE